MTDNNRPRLFGSFKDALWELWEGEESTETTPPTVYENVTNVIAKGRKKTEVTPNEEQPK